MPTLFDREVVVNAGGLRIASRSVSGESQQTLRVQFSVVRFLKKEPNTAQVVLYNLKKDNRARLQEKNLETTIDAGYSNNVSQIFSGQLEYGSSVQQGTDWLTTLQSGDGSQNFRKARINTSFKGPVKIGQVLRAAGEALGFKLGNLQQKIDEGSIRQELQEWTNGKVLSGKAEKVFDRIVKSLGYGWSVQDGQIQILGPKEVLSQTAIRLAVENGISTGLIGSPEPGEDGFVKARALLQPELMPGRRVQIQTREVDGFFRIEKSTFIGDTWGQEFYTDIEVKPI